MTRAAGGGTTRSATPPRLSLAIAALLWGAAALAAQEDEGWSPDTATVLFTSSRSGDSELWVQRGVGGQAVNVSVEPGQDHWASWSPDGTRIVFQSLRAGNREVYVMGADGSDSRNLTTHPSEDLLPEWSPDGTRILFFSTRGEERGPRGEFAGNLWVMNADGSEARRLTGRSLGFSFMGTWSPDGKTVVFSRSSEDRTGTDLYVLDVETGEERRLTNTPEVSEGGARFSPDGSRISLHISVGPEALIAVMDSGGSHTSYVTEGGLHYQPAWLPDGRWLLFTGADPPGEQYDLLAVPAAGGEPRPIVSTSADERSGSWARPAIAEEDGDSSRLLHRPSP